MEKVAVDTVKGKSGGIPLDVWNGSKATKELHAAIERIERDNAKLATRNYWVAVAAAVFSFVAMVASVIQIWQ